MTCIPGIYCILSHLPMPAKDVFQRADEEAGAREAFDDAALYDFEYRRRRADINFYRRLADDRRQFAPVGPVLDLACGTGRLLVPLLRDGHTVVGLDQSAPMLAAASRRGGPARLRLQTALCLGGGRLPQRAAHLCRV